VAEGVPHLDFRDMTEADLGDGLRLSRASGWNQTADDWRLLLALGAGLFRVAVQAGRILATGGAVRYGSDLAWICMILVDPEARGRGLGTRIFDEVLSRCDAAVRAGLLRAVGLDATPAGRPLYERVGFAPAYPLARLESGPPQQADRLTASGAETRRADTPAVVPLGEADLEQVLAWDREAFGADRSAVLRRGLGAEPGLAWSARRGDDLSGYLLGRRGDRFLHLGPLVARDTATAAALVRACRASCPLGAFGIDVPSDQPEWLARLAALGFQEKRPFTRMYRAGGMDLGCRETIFAIAGPELG
jgi:GNAT superfamily N-acetyltransferase